MLTLGVAAAAVLLKFAATATWDARIVLFVLGVSTARYYVRRDSLPIYLACLVGCVATMIAMGSFLNATVGVSTALVIGLLRARAWAPLTFLGSISYSLYLVHVPIGGRIVNLGRRFGDGAPYDLALSLFALGVSLIVAWICYRLVETTATRWSRRIVLRKVELPEPERRIGDVSPG